MMQEGIGNRERQPWADMVAGNGPSRDTQTDMRSEVKLTELSEDQMWRTRLKRQSGKTPGFLGVK